MFTEGCTIPQKEGFSVNTLKTWLLMGILTAIIVLLGSQFGGASGATLALLIALGINGASYFYSDKIALAVSGAKPVSEVNSPQLYTIVRHLSTRAGLPMPRVYMTPAQEPNAFATGRNPQTAVIVVNRGLLDVLTERELTGVLAHEMSHIRHRDILIASIAAALAGAITWIAELLRWGMFFGFSGNNDNRNQNVVADLAFIILAPVAALLIQLAISRSREYKADAGAAHLMRDPDALADALAKLGHTSRFGTRSRGQRQQPAAAAAMAHMYIVNPLSGAQLGGLFSTHPPMDERIRRLRLMRI